MISKKEMIQRVKDWWSKLQTKQFRFIEWPTRGEDGGRIVFMARILPAWEVIAVQLSDWGFQIRVAYLWLGFFMRYEEQKKSTPAAQMPKAMSTAALDRIRAHEEWKKDRNIDRVYKPDESRPSKGTAFIDLGDRTACRSCHKRYCVCEERQPDGSWRRKP